MNIYMQFHYTRVLLIKFVDVHVLLNVLNEIHSEIEHVFPIIRFINFASKYRTTN